MPHSNRLLIPALLAMTLSALQPFSPSAVSSTAPVNIPASERIDVTKQPTLFMVGYAHLDTQWRWDYVKTIREFLPSTYNDNFSLFKKFPHYTFNFTGAGRYKLIKDYYPEAFEEIRKAVAAGRWWPNGTSWEENDANAPSAESQIRQFLYGHEFFQKEFGIESNDFILPDCFGFPAALPSILAHCGIRGFSTQKLSWGSANGIPFNVGEWVGTDDNSIIAALNALGYGRPIKQDPATDPYWIDRIKKNGDDSGIYADYTYIGTGDIGGSAKPESVANEERGVTDKNPPVRINSGRADLLFNSISDEQMKALPKYKGDLLLTEHSAGSITSQGYMKRWNRANELLADAAERASVAALLVAGTPYPREKLTAAWQIVLRSQFHDTLPGTCIPKAYEYAWNDEVLCMNTFSDILTSAVASVAGALSTRFEDGDVPLVIFNPLSIDREDVVEATVTLPGLGASPEASHVLVSDTDDHPLPVQILSRDGDTCRILFIAKVPSVGFTVYPVSVAGADAPASNELKVTDRTLENARYRITLNNAGDIAGIFDKQAKRELLASPARLAFQTEQPAKWPAWNMDWNDRQHPPRGYVGDDGKARIEIAENGPVRIALRVTRDAEHSNFVQTIRLAAGDAGNRIEVVNEIDWRSKGASLKASFPLTVSNPLATYNEDLGKIQRANNDPKKFEVPTHQWFDLTDKSGAYGVTILTAAKYGSDKPDDNTVRLTLLYTPASKDKGYREQRWQDWGRHDITYGIYGHAGDWRKGAADWQALRMEQPLLAFVTDQHNSRRGNTYSLLKLDTTDVAVRAIKLAESGDKVIVRLQELNGAPQTTAHLASPDATINGVTEVNGVEKPLGKSSLALDFKKFQLHSLALDLAKPPAKPAPADANFVTLPYNMNAFGARGAKGKDAGDFDGAGATYPAEMISDIVTSGGVTFKIAPRAVAQNAVRCEGQTIALPAGNANCVYLIAAALGGDTDAQFTVANAAGEKQTTTLRVQSWTGYIGQWDNRVFKGEVPEMSYSVNNPLERIDTGYIKRAPVAWYCDHHYTKGGRDAIYQYCYLFKYTLGSPAGAKTVTLPNNPNIRVFAMTAAQTPYSDTHPARPLYDDFTGRKPIVIPAGWANSNFN